MVWGEVFSSYDHAAPRVVCRGYPMRACASVWGLAMDCPGMFPGTAALLAAVAAGAAQGLEVLVKGHGSPVLCETFSCWAMQTTISMVATLTVQTRRSRSMTLSLWSENR